MSFGVGAGWGHLPPPLNLKNSDFGGFRLQNFNFFTFCPPKEVGQNFGSPWKKLK